MTKNWYQEPKKPNKADLVNQKMVDACFNKMNSVYGTYKFKDEDWVEMFKSSPEITKRICDIERMQGDILTLGDLVEYYDLHCRMWKKFNAKKNSFSKRYQTEIVGN